jgi:putative spermidine/putrescine transport system permease protein
MFLCWAALAVVLVILILPLLVVIPTAFNEGVLIRFPPKGFSWKWFEEVLTSEQWLGSFFKSVRIGLMTAVVAMLAGLALARVGTRIGSSFWRMAIQVAAISPLIVPVILLAIGVFDVQNRIALLGTDLGLVLAHAVLCLPLTFLVMANGLAFIDISLEQAAWTMGASRARAFWTVVVPSLLPAVVGSLVISFVTSWDETVLALFQTGLDKTLPVTIYSFLKSGITPAVSAVATLVTVPVLLGSVILGARALRRTRPMTLRTQP